MELKPIVNQLAYRLPYNTDKFNDKIEISSITTSGTIATIVTTTPHNLNNGQSILIFGALDYVEVTSLSVTDNIATCITAQDHGLNLTFNFIENKGVNEVIKPQGTIADADQVIFNNTFNLTTQPNEYKYTFDIETSDQTATGQIKSIKYNSSRFKGLKNATVIDSTTLTIEVESGYNGLIGGNSYLATNVRVGRAMSLEQLIKSYTKHPANKYWIFVADATSTGSPNRRVKSNANDYNVNGVEYSIITIENFSLYVFIPASDNIGGGAIYDDFEAQKTAILKSILGYKPPSQYTTQEGFGVIFLSSQYIYYNKAFFVGEIKLQYQQRITFYDTYSDDEYYPMREITGFLAPVDTQDGDLVLNLNINLDDDAGV